MITNRKPFFIPSGLSAKGLRLLCAITILISISSSTIAQFLYGTTRAGGSSGGGTIFKTYTDGTGLSTEYNFLVDSNPGRWPDNAQMVLVGSNKLYGMTPHGGKFDGGVLYEYTAGGAYI